jgi:adenine C2-methylase RlmN of 23S rRNA A2503 and tRNA A37
MDTTIALIIPILAFVVIGTRMLFGKWDKSRIRKYIQQRGGQVTSIEWNPFATGWLYANHDRLYTVAFMDNAGKHYNTRKMPNKSVEQNALHASCGLLASRQPARITPGVA